VIFDSDVLVWLLRGNPVAEQFVADSEARATSIVAYMELLQGARDRQDLRHVKAVLSDFGFEVLPLSEATSHRAAVYVEEHALSSRLGVTDALIAATAVEHGLVLCTGNVKHYRAIQELDVLPFRP
jgi:predicted nucleic acid-binding protein